MNKISTGFETCGRKKYISLAVKDISFDAYVKISPTT